MSKIINDYYEFFKLSIIDIIIVKFTNKPNELLSSKHIIYLQNTRTRLGILLNTTSNYKSIVKDIRNLKLDFENEDVRFNTTISVLWGTRDNIIEKSHHALLLAANQKDKYYEFK